MRTVCAMVLAVCVASLFLGGCAHDEEGVKPAQEMFDEAQALARKKSVEKASEAFMQVRTYYPSHDLARMALLATADLYYDNEDYESALKNYQEFRLLYPTDAEAGRCLYRIGMCHFQQMGTFDRDQSQTSRAIQSLDAFLKTYPDSPHAEDAALKLKEARTLLARHDLSIGRFYLKKGNHKAACARFTAVKRQYPDVTLEDDIDALILQACTSGPAAKE
ncbi:MAG TPA: outer membrane protein assembly factor BamD [Deltaproteobacteria bacterium]|nr:outer membrane protein assembly factor BamD [Deltaproteobacteria bacterium]